MYGNCVDKQAQLPPDIRWHFIGHLQSNKVKYIAPFVYLIQGVDSFKLLKEIDRQASRNGRSIDVLLQVHIAREETKFGLDAMELAAVMGAVRAGEARSKVAGHWGLMKGWHSCLSMIRTLERCREEFRDLKVLFDAYFLGDTRRGGHGPAVDGHERRLQNGHRRRKQYGADRQPAVR